MYFYHVIVMYELLFNLILKCNMNNPVVTVTVTVSAYLYWCMMICILSLVARSHSNYTSWNRVYEIELL